MNIKFDKKDLRLLSLLDSNARLLTTKLAKGAQISQQVADYRLKKLVSQGTIYHFYTYIDFGRLGYSLFRLHIKLKNISENQRVSFAKKLFIEYPSFWVGFVSGTFDIIADIFAKTANEFENIFTHMLNNYKDYIQGCETTTLLELKIYTYAHFLDESKEKQEISLYRNREGTEIDKKDIQILRIIRTHARLSYNEIGKQIGISRNVVKYRMKKLEEKNIIVGYHILINYTQFEKHSYKVFLKYNYSKIQQENKLLSFLKSTKGMLSVAKQLGKWNLDFEIHLDGPRELQQYIIELRNLFEIIESSEFVELLDDYGIDFFPDKLKLN